jgi:hypothetical protein
MKIRQQQEFSLSPIFTIPWLPIFIALKLISVYGATWSWWWLLMPIVPVIGCFAHRWLL